MLDYAKVFDLKGNAISAAPCGSGHINSTFKVKTDAGTEYILQKINTGIFPDPDMLMSNIDLVTCHLRSKGLDDRHVLKVIRTKEDKLYYKTDSGECWRMYEFIQGSISLNLPETEHDFYESGAAFGNFQKLLSDFPAEKLGETIPRFHDTVKRLEDFKAAVSDDKMGRAEGVRKEIDFFLERGGEAGLLVNALKNGEIPLRVTHNDTKLNNVLLDAVTKEPLCVIDLDTVMPGAAAYDFGDSIRFGASTALEDEKDLDKVTVSLPMYETYLDGFLGACGGSMDEKEKRSLLIGAKLMTYEVGIRFLGDYLNGDVYFSIARPEHNLDRARTQMKLIADMELKWDQMEKILEKYL